MTSRSLAALLVALTILCILTGHPWLSVAIGVNAAGTILLVLADRYPIERWPGSAYRARQGGDPH